MSLIPLGILAGVGGRASSYESIATVTATGGETSFTFSSIPQTYASLQVRCFLRRNTTNAANMGFRPNNDTSTASYTRHSLIGNGATVSAAGSATGTYSYTQNFVTVPGTTSGAYAGQIWDILDYASTTKYKTFRSFAGYDANGSGEVGLNSNLWLSTSAITSLVVYFAGDAVDAGSTFALYGIKG
jgi:hypothetical protein